MAMDVEDASRTESAMLKYYTKYILWTNVYNKLKVIESGTSDSIDN